MYTGVSGIPGSNQKSNNIFKTFEDLKKWAEEDASEIRAPYFPELLPRKLISVENINFLRKYSPVLIGRGSSWINCEQEYMFSFTPTSIGTTDLLKKYTDGFVALQIFSAPGFTNNPHQFSKTNKMLSSPESLSSSQNFEEVYFNQGNFSSFLNGYNSLVGHTSLLTQLFERKKLGNAREFEKFFRVPYEDFIEHISKFPGGLETISSIRGL